jgi:hypothetical protein
MFLEMRVPSAAGILKVRSDKRKDLDRMVNWTKTWQMIFNPLKCYVLKITKKKKTVDFDYNINGQSEETVASSKLANFGCDVIAYIVDI